MRRELRERFPRHRRVAGKRSQHSRRMRNPQFYVSGKKPIGPCLGLVYMRDRHLKGGLIGKWLFRETMPC